MSSTKKLVPPPEVREWYSKIGTKGGYRRAAVLTPAQRREIGLRGWQKYQEEQGRKQAS